MNLINLKRLKVYLEKNRLMSVATIFGNKSWSATVFYAYDNENNILFYSRDDTKHCQNINKNKNVSVVINHTWKQKNGGINGVQITGVSEKVSIKNYEKMYKIYKKRFPWAKNFEKDHRMYLIKPKEIWLIDEDYFGHFDRVRVK